MKNLLLITPGFHGYWKSIERAFEARGYDVTTHCYDDGSRLEKAFNKVRYELPSRIRGQQSHLSPEVVSRRAIEQIRTVAPSHILVVRGDILTDEFWQAVHDSGAARLLWLYDELRRMNYDEATIGSYASIASYSPLDVQHLCSRGIPATYVPLAYDPHVTIDQGEWRGEVSFIGARFPKRETYLRALHDAGVPLRCYGREWSSHWFDRLRTFRWEGVRIPGGRDLPLDQAWRTMRDSAATINIHGDQDGFTMRTFEACGVGAVQFVDRADVSDHFEPGKEVLVFETPEELIELGERATNFPHEFDDVRIQGHRRATAAHTFDHRAETLDTLWA